MKNPLARSIALRAAIGAVVLITLPALTCTGGAMDDDSVAAEAEPAVITGVTTREAIEEANPAWAAAVGDAEIDDAAAAELISVPPGAELTIFLGTWCSDSRREVPRFWRALDHVEKDGRSVPFRVEYVAVDRHKEQPADRIAAADIRYVPTFIVRRDGAEVGRIVESSPHGIESDLVALLTGEATGVVSGRDDL